MSEDSLEKKFGKLLNEFFSRSPQFIKRNQRPEMAAENNNDNKNFIDYESILEAERISLYSTQTHQTDKFKEVFVKGSGDEELYLKVTTFGKNGKTIIIGPS